MGEDSLIRSKRRAYAVEDAVITNHVDTIRLPAQLTIRRTPFATLAAEIDQRTLRVGAEEVKMQAYSQIMRKSSREHF